MNAADSTDSSPERQRIEDALVELLATDEYGNSFRYFRATDLQAIDSELSSAVIGSFLPQIEDDSPLPNGLIVERYTDRRGGASLWIARTEDR